MYSIITVAIIGVLIGLIVAAKSRGESADGKLGAFILSTIVGGVIGAVVGVILGLILANFVPMKTVHYGPAELASVRTSDGITGAFVWGTGSISSDSYFHFFIRNDDGSLTPGKLIADDTVRIIQDPELKDKGTWSSVGRSKDRSAPLASWALGLRDSDTIDQQILRVPVGTVVQSFKVD